jgi:acyl-CoA reductase-like NAD-dependent aldehyde dehydrogenase
MIDPNMPFGGVKQSGTGRDFGVDWLDAYLRGEVDLHSSLVPEKQERTHAQRS